MTMEEMKDSMGRLYATRDQFPVGMRVLAVDDDLTCLKLLEALLRRCQYNVTTTNQAITALKLLRENKNGFDLVISDVHMPDMDGFKLLERVGLEMDLPVIMLSANGETSAVMKGITHGACDYLLKPIRIEELKNIWQHVIRRRKFDNIDVNNFDNGNDGEKPQVNSDDGHGPFMSGSSDHNGKLNRKRKDQNEEDEHAGKENINENEDPSMQKRPRVVWSIELHHKFVAAVNQLGIDKAVPKRILDMMNVEKLTRENVASHLQKYRLYLKRLNAAASQQANLVTTFGGRDPSYLPISSLDRYRNFNALMKSGQLPALHSFQPSGFPSRMNYPTGMGLHVLPSAGAVQSACSSNNVSNSINDVSNFHHMMSPGNHQENLFQALSAKLELDHLKQMDVNSCVPSGFSGCGLPSAISRNSSSNTENSSILLQSNQQPTQARVLGNPSSIDVPSLSSDPFQMTVGSLKLPDLARCNPTWQSAGPITKSSTITMPINAPLINSDFGPSKVADTVTSVISPVDENCHYVSRNVVAAPLHDFVTGIDTKSQGSPLVRNMMLIPRTTHISEDSISLNYRHTGNSNQNEEERTKVHSHKPNLTYSSSTSPSWPSYNVGHLSENQRLHSGLCNIKTQTNAIAQSNFGTSLCPQYCKIDKPTTDHQMNEDEYSIEGSKLLDELRCNGGSLDDLVNDMIQLESNYPIFMDGGMGCDIFPLGEESSYIRGW